ncbi:PCI-domain-containing protein [Sparassis latifolia]
MPATDSVSVFTEGTFSEQIRELVVYLARGHPEEERASYIQPFQDVLTVADNEKPIEEDEDRRRKVLTMVVSEVKGLGDGTDKEIEGFFNLLFSHFLTVLPLDAPETKVHLIALLQAISSTPDQTLTKYRILSNIFNAIPGQSPLRLLVYKTLIEIASASDELEHLTLERAKVEKWLQEWDVSQQEKSDFLKSIADAFAKCQELGTSYEYTLSYVNSLPPSSPSAHAAAVDAIATALRLPSLFDFDPLFRLDAVVSAKDHELFSLLQIFLNEGLPEYHAWSASHANAFAQYGLDKEQLERKIKLLSLTTLGFQNIGHDLPYASIASTLQVEPSQVERWVIDVIRAGLVSGRLSQTTQTLHITRAAARAFERPQWELLEKRLGLWKTSIAEVLEVVAAARKNNTTEAVGAAGASAAPNGTETPVIPAKTAAAA